jgi:Transglycosylase SLT domain
MTVTAYRRELPYTRRRSVKNTRLRRGLTLGRIGIFGIAGFFLLNWTYQVIRKPGELLAPVSAAFSKSPQATWDSYGELFEQHSTSIILPEFLAALAQIESGGNPIARTYWRWQWSWNPLEIYRPASSAVGMFQFTDGTFAAAKRYCVQDHEVRSREPWYSVDSCWFNSLYTRTIPSHAIELTAAYLHQAVIDTLAVRPRTKANVLQKQQLAAVIHVCGPKRGEAFAKRGFRLVPAERCGSHSLRRYLDQIDRMQRVFARIRRA